MKPLITLYRPEQRGDRWFARADVNARGERIELTASASTRLAQVAQNWYNRASSWVSQWIKLEGFDERQPVDLGAGVFADVPAIAHEVATSIQAIPHDPEIEAAADLYRAALVGNLEALSDMDQIIVHAQTDERAAEALEMLQLVDMAARAREALPLSRVFYDASRGEPDARKVVAALREMTSTSATRLEWCIDDYQECGPGQICTDLQCACADEIGARIIQPTGSNNIRRLRPSLDEPMLRIYQAISAVYG